MQDKETDSFWSIMKGRSIGGELDGTNLEELPVGEKMRWAEWVQLHPDTLVLSVGGREDLPRNAYEGYFSSEEGFRGSEAADPRLETKTPIFAFTLDATSYAAPFRAIEEGAAFQVGSESVFLFREEDQPVLTSTRAFRTDSGRFVLSEGRWRHEPSGAIFDPQAARFQPGSEEISKISGFDTFWYTWSPAHPETRILSKSEGSGH